MKIQFLVFASLVVLFSCDGQEQTSDVQSDADAFAFRSYTIDLEAPKVKLSELIDEIHVVRLEETESSLLGNIMNVKQNEDHFYFSNGKEKALYFFDRQGNYINKIERSGEGPEEYDNILSYWTKGDTVKIFDLSNAEILSYTPSGDFLASTTLPYRPIHLLETEEGYWLNINDQIEGDSLNHEMVFINHQLEEERFYLPVAYAFGVPVYSNVNNFSRVEGQPVYKHFLKDTMYVISKHNVKPFLHFDFGSDFMWADPVIRKDANAAMQSIGQNGKVWVFNPSVGTESIYLTYNTSFQDSEHMLIDRSNGRAMRIDRRNAEGERMNFAINFWDSESLMLSINATDLVGLLASLDPSQYSFEEGSSLEDIESSENPALVWVKFKKPY